MLKQITFVSFKKLTKKLVASFSPYKDNRKLVVEALHLPFQIKLVVETEVLTYA